MTRATFTQGCVVKGAHVEPCAGLAFCIERGAVEVFQLVARDHDRERTQPGIRKGQRLNAQFHWCPFCGERITTAFPPDAADAAAGGGA